MKPTSFAGATLLLCLVGCSSSSSPSPSSGSDASDFGGSDASTTHPDDATTSNPGTDGSTSTADAGDPNASPGDCYPTATQTGNELHVGAYCTKGGGQCSKFGNSELQCSSDLSSTAGGGNFCLLLNGCTQDSNCGSDSCCTGPSGSPILACIPLGCFDSGVCSKTEPN